MRCRTVQVVAAVLRSYMTVSHSVALLGFRAFERNALTSAFQMSLQRGVGYHLVDRVEDSRFAVVDADGDQPLDVLNGGPGLRDAVFVGAQAPAGARAWLMRPLDAARVLQELDLLSASARLASGKPLEQAADPALMGGPLPGRRVFSADGVPMPSVALGRRMGDALGAVLPPGRADRRS